MIKFLYTLAMHLYRFAVYVFSFFNKKAKSKYSGSKASILDLKDFKGNSSSKRVLIHCASQGEHEQATPIIQWILKHTDLHILLTFSSPSGYNNANYNHETRVTKTYLPFDIPNQVENFLDSVNPILIIIIKNEKIIIN